MAGAVGSNEARVAAGPKKAADIELEVDAQEGSFQVKGAESKSWSAAGEGDIALAQDAVGGHGERLEDCCGPEERLKDGGHGEMLDDCATLGQV